MTNRPTEFLRAIFTCVIACGSIATIPLNAEAAPGECLVARPKTAAPPGQFWLHLNDWATNRHCWVLRARIETTSQAKGAIAVQAPRPATRATGAPPARTPEDAATNEPATRTDSPQLHKDDGKAASGAGAAPEHADQSLSYAEHSDAAQLPPLASGTPEATDAHAAASGSTSTLAFAVRTQEIKRATKSADRPACEHRSEFNSRPFCRRGHDGNARDRSFSLSRADALGDIFRACALSSRSPRDPPRGRAAAPPSPMRAWATRPPSARCCRLRAKAPPRLRA